MKSFRQSLRLAATAAKTNLLPGLLLQCLMVAFFSLYIAHEGTRNFLGEIATVKQQTGYAFSFFSYVIAGALLPELIRIAFFQSGKVTSQNVWLFVTAAPIWGFLGMAIDLFYRFQTVWFGTGHDFLTLLCKVLVDQMLFSPLFGIPVVVAWFLLRDEGFRPSAWKKIFCSSFILEKVFPVQVAGWCVWIPGVTLVYFMPLLLQLPVAVLIQVFWALMFTTMEEKLRRRASV
ncbi:MAG: hypothetical protein ACOYM3_15490 [Terrimicrobiaceae bacterium]